MKVARVEKGTPAPLANFHRSPRVKSGRVEDSNLKRTLEKGVLVVHPESSILEAQGRSQLQPSQRQLGARYVLNSTGTELVT